MFNLNHFDNMIAATMPFQHDLNLPKLYCADAFGCVGQQKAPPGALVRFCDAFAQASPVHERCTNEVFARAGFVETSFVQGNPIADLSEVSVGQHFYWQIGGYPVHGQVLLTSWLVLGSIAILSLLANLKLETSVPSGLQNVTEYITEFIRDLAKAQIGEEEYSTWVPFLGTIFLFIFVSNWSGALLPWRLIELPNGELAAPTNDINTTVSLALLTSVAYFYAGLRKKGLGYFKRYIEPAAFLLPINILEDFTKPLSLSFRLFGNILADELVVGVLIALVPIVVPIPLMLLGLFTSAIQALVFATLAGAYIGEALEGH